MTDVAESYERRDPMFARALKDIPLRELEQEFSRLLSRLGGRGYVAAVLRLHFEPDDDSRAMEIDFRVRPQEREK